MQQIIGLISANYSNDSFAQLTHERPIASLPFGGRYRLVDFPLSNMVNSGIFTVGLVTPYLYRSIMDHVGAGKEWLLDRKVGGMFILPGSIFGLKKFQSKFLLRDLIQNRTYLDRSQSKLVVISSCSKVFNIDFRDVAEFHTAHEADITLIYKRANTCCTSDELYLEAGDDGRVTSIYEKGGRGANYFLEALIIKRELLLKFIDGYEAISYIDLTEIIVENLNHLSVYGYQFTGYVGNIGSVKCYMKTSRDLLEPEINHELFRSDRPIRTKIQDSPPAKYWPTSDVKNSLVSSGCIIKGTVENSIIFRGVTVEEGTSVKDCIIMQNTIVRRDSVLEKVICDKYVVIGHGVKLLGSDTDPFVIGKRQEV